MRLGEIYRGFASSVAIMLITAATCVAASSVSLNQNGNAQQQAQVEAVEAGPEQTKQKAAAKKPSQKSVLDADVLESPMSFFKSAFSDEESSETSSPANTLVVAMKALVATLLTTII